MCGIIGYKGSDNASEIVLEGLKKLEYRGYDSFGLAIQKEGGFEIQKYVGKIGGFNEELLKSNLAVGHTRWATHGAVTEQNCHPHVCHHSEITVVHNGIIENYRELKDELSNHTFRSDTDTEIIAHLIGNYDLPFEQAFKEAIKKLDGTFAIIAVKKDSNKILVARRGSPIVIGVDGDNYFVASDVPAFLEHTNKVIFLEDDEIAEINNNIRIYNFNTDKEIKREPVEISWNVEQAQKDKFPHFMLKEIHEQGKVIEKIIEKRIDGDKILFNNLNLTDEEIKEINRIVFVACGTSWHVALVGEFMLEELAKIPCEVEYASEFRYRDPILDKNTLVISISQSGETADTLAGLREAKEKGAKILSLVNVPGSTIDRESDSCLHLDAGPEIGVASTKAFSSQLVILYLMTIHFGKIRGVLPEQQVKNRIRDLKLIPGLIYSILNNGKEIFDCAEKYYDRKNALYLGRGNNYPIALEGALKLKEVSYIHAEGYPAAEMKHGPIALIDKEMPVFFVATKDSRTYKKVISNIEEVRSRGGIIISVATLGDDEIKRLSDYVIYIPETSYILTPLLAVIPFQLLAYYIADKKECDVDKPRNLAKSVTVE